MASRRLALSQVKPHSMTQRRRPSEDSLFPRSAIASRRADVSIGSCSGCPKTYRHGRGDCGAPGHNRLGRIKQSRQGWAFRDIGSAQPRH